jgi:hypothetical protein
VVDLVLIVELHEREQRLARQLLLLRQERVEAADRVVPQSAHRARAVQHDRHERRILFHQSVLSVI